MASRTPSRLLNLQRTQQTIRLQATKSRPRSQCIRPGSDSTPAASRYWYTVQYDVRRKYSTESSSAQSDTGSSFADAANAVVHGSRRTESETSSYYEQGTFVPSLLKTPIYSHYNPLFFLAYPTPQIGRAHV